MKEVMVAERKRIQGQINANRKDRKRAEKERNHKEMNRIDSQIEHLERNLKLYKASVQPVQFQNGVIVNGKLLTQYVKKCPSGFIDAELTDGHLYIKHKAGRLTLQNTAKYYFDLDLPTGEALLDELGIALKVYEANS